jgi:hypothetical protein
MRSLLALVMLAGCAAPSAYPAFSPIPFGLLAYGNGAPHYSDVSGPSYAPQYSAAHFDPSGPPGGYQTNPQDKYYQKSCPGGWGVEACRNWASWVTDRDNWREYQRSKPEPGKCNSSYCPPKGQEGQPLPTMSEQYVVNHLPELMYDSCMTELRSSLPRSGLNAGNSSCNSWMIRPH